MTMEEVIQELQNCKGLIQQDGQDYLDKRDIPLLDMAIEALQFVEHFDLLKEYQSLQEVVMCKDCRYANECHKSVQYTRNEPNTVTIGFSQIEWCSKGERKEE